ncbi:MAG: rRNA maturation RNase YbeY [Bacteroidetes bacterium]|nr:rRNA maturation RNase YbeY [Bacteroidota bacterium]
MNLPEFAFFPDEDIQSGVFFQSADVEFELYEQEIYIRWIESVIKKESRQLQLIHYIFCSDNYLHKINLQYLAHDTLTDIITFPYGENPINGEIYISIDRLHENAKKYRVPFEQELQRVMIHGVLHLCGYDDKRIEAKKQMTAKENEYLLLLGMVH